MTLAPHNLPPEATSLVGRDGELAAVAALFAAGARLVTITGPPGVGKSRLALRHGWALAEADAGAVWRCDLHDVTEAAAVECALRALQTAAEEPPGRGRPTRFILDGAEHLLEALRPPVTALLASAHAATVLVTSREPLGLPGERSFVLLGLGLGPGVRTGDGHALLDASADPAVALLLERASALGYDPARDCVSAHRSRVLSELATRLDRNPLALELAARRLVVMTPCQLLARLDDRLALLRPPTGGAPAEPHHLPSLSDAFERSWRLLSPAERSALAQLAVFARPAELDAVEAVVHVGDDRALPDVIDALMRKSLVQVQPASPAGRRLDLGANLRAFARVRLEADRPALAAVVDRHAAYFAARVERLAGLAPSRATSQRQLGDELEATLGVVDWALHPALCDAPRLARAATLLLTVRPTMQRRGPLSRAAACFEAVLGQRERLPPDLVVRLEAALGELLYRCGRGDEAARRLVAALASAREAGDEVGEALIVRALGVSFVYGRADVSPGELAAARETLEAERADADAAAARLCIANAAGESGPPEEALALYREALEAARRGGDVRQRAWVEVNLGALLAHLGRPDEAVVFYRTALARSHELDDMVLEAVVLANLGIAAFERHDDEEARALFTQASALARDVDYPRIEAVAELYLGLLAWIARSLPGVELHLGAGLASWDRAWRSPWEQALLALGLAVVEAARGRDGTARRWAERVLLATEGQPGATGPALVALAELAVTAAPTGLEAVLTAARAIAEPALDALRGRPRAGAPQLRAALRLFGQPAPAVARLGALSVAPDGRHFVTPDGRRVALGRRGPARRLLVGLAEAAVHHPGSSLSVPALFDLGWPGDNVNEPYRSNRVYVVVADLRKLGLGDLLANDGDGYRLIGAPVRVASGG